MLQTVARGEATMERKVISISVKRQLTIPQKYYEELGFNNEAECIVKDGGIFIRPVHTENNYFSEEILADLIEQGLSGQELLAEFKESVKKVRPAVQKLINEADELAKSNMGKSSLDDIFGAEE